MGVQPSQGCAQPSATTLPTWIADAKGAVDVSESIEGLVTDGFAGVAEVLADNLASGADLGASVAVTLAGEMVVDVWGGWADPDKTKPWVEDTITNVWSTTKTMLALSALACVEQGKLDVFAPVAQYWPEFGANGKEAITVAELMSHTSGVSGWDQPVVVDDIYDWERSTAMLAAQAPWWEPGAASGYHALNQGHLVGEVVRRVTGQSIGSFFATHIAQPLGADFHIGLPAEHDHRVSPVVPPPPLPIDPAAMDPDSPAVKTFTGPAPAAEEAWTEAWRRAEIPAANGHGNARSVARIQAVVANGGEIDGVKILSPDVIDLIFQEQANGVDQVLGVPIRFGIGYGLADPVAVPWLPQRKICYWGGWGGSVIVVDVERQMTVAYMMNRMEAGLVGDTRGEAIVQAAFAATD